MAKKKQDDADEIPEEGDGTVAVNDAWTGLLAISLLALLGATGFLVWDWYLMPENPTAPYRFTNKPPGPLAAPKAAPPKAEENKPAPPPKVDDNKDKDKEKEKEKDADKDKDKDKDKGKDKEKGKAQTPIAPDELVKSVPPIIEAAPEPRRIFAITWRRES